MNSITLNKVQSEISDIYVKLTDISRQLTSANLSLAGIETNVMMLINQAAQSNSGNPFALQGLKLQGAPQTSGNIQSQQYQNIFPVYFSNVTNVIWGDAKNNSIAELTSIDTDLKQIIDIMNKCGCGSKGDNENSGKKILEDLSEIGGEISATAKMLNFIDDGISFLDSKFHFLPYSKEFNEKREFNDIISEDFGIGKGKRVGYEYYLHNAMQNAIFKNSVTQSQANDFQTHLKLPELSKLNPNGYNLYEILIKGQQLLDKNGYSNLDLIGKFLPKDNYGNIGPHKNVDLYNSFKNYGYVLPYLDQLPKESINKHAQLQHSLKQLKRVSMPQLNHSLYFKNFPESQHIYTPQNNFKSVFPKTDRHGIKLDTPGYQNKPGAQIRGKKDSTVINIKIDGLIKQFTINTTNMQESSGKIQDMVSQVLLKAVNDSTLIAGV